MASLSLQAVLFFLSGFRKRHSSTVLRVLLWLAYLSADSLAVYVLGRLAIRGGGNPFALFWAPFLLLHLGGQETMTAFSMEDNALWKRHLLSFATQVPMVIYVVTKQLRGEDRRLVAPMVLVFASGTAKYAERIWALRRAGSVIPGSSSSSSSNRVSRASDDAIWDTQEYYKMLGLVVSNKQETNFEVILNVAAEYFKTSLHFFMGTTPSISLLPDNINEIENAVQGLKSSENILHMAYKMAEINLSLIYDYLYTKFGTRHFHMPPGCIAYNRIVPLSLTLVALGLFIRAITGPMEHDAADIIISYILLVGAIVLETCSIFMSFISSCWAYRTIMSCPLKCPLCRKFPRGIALMLSIARLLHPENRQVWSGKLVQYSLIRKCIYDKQESGLFRRVMRWVGIDDQALIHLSVAPELKKLVLYKLLDIATTPRGKEWDISKFHGQWAQWLVETMHDQHQSAARQVLQVSNIQRMEFVASALLWHVVTDILLSTDDAASSSGNERLDGASSSGNDVDAVLRLRGSAIHLSDYIMYLVAHCGAIDGSDGHYAVVRAHREVSRWILMRGGCDRGNVIKEIYDEDRSFFHEDYYPLLDRGRRVASDMHQIGQRDRWELLATVQIEMLCYIAYNCGAAFHTKHLTTGGEFVTHVKMLLFMLGVPFVRDVKEPLFPNTAGNVYS
ncbi:unnamed protein product [Urochloa humidicola]